MTDPTPPQLTQLRIPILRSSRPELAREFYNGLLGGRTTVLGTQLEEATGETWGIVVDAPAGGLSRWFPHMVTDDLDPVKDQVRSRGGTYHRDSSPFEHLVVTAPDRSQIIVTERAADDSAPIPRQPGHPLRVMLELCTREIETSSDFYTDILRLSQVPVPDDPYSYRVLFAGSVGVAGAVDMTTFFLDRTDSHWIPYFHVDDIDESLQTAAAYGARVTVPTDASMFGARYAVLTDPTGATFGLRGYPPGGIFGYFSGARRRFLDAEEIAALKAEQARA